MSASREKRNRQIHRTNEDPAKKKKHGSSDKFRRNVAICVAVVVVLAVAAILLVNSAIPQQVLTAYTIDGDKISVAEYNFSYYSVRSSLISQYQQYGMEAPADTDMYDQQNNITFADYFRQQAVEQLKELSVQFHQAKTAGMTLNAEESSQIDQQIAYFASSASTAGKGLNDYLSAAYGKGVTEPVVRSMLERIFLANRWVSDTYESLMPEGEPVDTHYAENRDKYDYVNYRAQSFSMATTEDTTNMTDEEKTAANDAAKQQAKTKADAMLAEVTTMDAFAALAAEYVPPAAPAEGEEAAAPQDTTLHEKAYAMSLSSAMSDYLFSADRKPGDKTVIEDTSSYTVVLFDRRTRDEETSVNVRHILFMAASGDDADMQAAQNTAEQALQTWKSGPATEESFSELAKSATEDTASKETGGLYENIVRGQMVPNFDAWIFDAARKPGDTGVVTNVGNYNGAHIIYFVSGGRPVWYLNVQSDLTSEAYTAKMDALKKDVVPQENSFGMRFALTTY